MKNRILSTFFLLLIGMVSAVYCNPIENCSNLKSFGSSLSCEVNKRTSDTILFNHVNHTISVVASIVNCTVDPVVELKVNVSVLNHMTKVNLTNVTNTLLYRISTEKVFEAYMLATLSKQDGDKIGVDAKISLNYDGSSLSFSYYGSIRCEKNASTTIALSTTTSTTSVTNNASGITSEKFAFTTISTLAQSTKKTTSTESSTSTIKTSEATEIENKTNATTTATPTTVALTSAAAIKFTTKATTTKATTKPTTKSITFRTHTKGTLKVKTKATSKPRTRRMTLKTTPYVKRRSKTTKAVLLILAIIILIAVIGLLIYCRKKKRLSNQPAYYNDIVINDPIKFTTGSDVDNYNEDEIIEDDDELPLVS